MIIVYFLLASNPCHLLAMWAERKHTTTGIYSFNHKGLCYESRLICSNLHQHQHNNSLFRPILPQKILLSCLEWGFPVFTTLDLVTIFNLQSEDAMLYVTAVVFSASLYCFSLRNGPQQHPFIISLTFGHVNGVSREAQKCVNFCLIILLVSVKLIWKSIKDFCIS